MQTERVEQIMDAKVLSKSIRLSKKEEKFLDRYHISFSTQLRSDLALLEKLIHAGQREIAGNFTVSEACLIADVMTNIDMSGNCKLQLVSVFEDAVAMGVVGEKWAVSENDVLKKINGLSELGALACMHLALLVRRESAESRMSFKKLVIKIFPKCKHKAMG